MASPAKVQKLDNEMSGYIHDVSPIKCSAKNTKYFTCVIQNDRDEYHKGVVFNPIKHREMEQAASHQTGIKLLDVKRTLSFNGNQSTADNYDILVNRQTSILVTNLPFPCKMPLQNRSMTLQQVAALQPFQRVGETNVKVVNVGCTDMVPIYGTLMEVQNCCVADQTAQIKVALYDSQVNQLKIGKSYKISNLATRNKDTIYLTSTRATTFLQIADIQVPTAVATLQLEDHGALTVYTGVITATNLTVRRRCQKCNKNQAAFNEEAKHNRCGQCNFLQKTSAFTATMSGTLMLTCDSGEDMVITAPPSVLAMYLHGLDQQQIGDVQAIEVHLVDSGPFDVEVNKSSVATKLTLSTNHNAPASVSGDSLAEDGLGLDTLFDCT